MFMLVTYVLVIAFALLAAVYWHKTGLAEDVISARNQKISSLTKERDEANERALAAGAALRTKEAELAEMALRNRYLSQALELVAKLAPDRPSLAAWEEEEHEKFLMLMKQLGMKPIQLGFKSNGVYWLWRRDYYMRRARRELVDFRNRKPESPLTGEMVLERLTMFFTRSGLTQEIGLSIIQAKLEEFAPGAPPVRRLQQIEFMPPAE